MSKKVKAHKAFELTKKLIRSKILARLRLQKEEERKRKSKLIQKKLFQIQAFKKAKRVMFYIPFDGEVNTKEMIRLAQKLGKIITVPVCKNNRFIAPCLLASHAKLKRGFYGVWEPARKQFMDARNIDLVIVPGIAFDKQGNRLGRGKGCYDDFLSSLSRKTASIGLAFDFQILPSVPATVTDVSVKRVIFA